MSLRVHKGVEDLRAYARERIRNLIVQGGLRRDDPLPRFRDLGERLGVSLQTLHNAVQDLRDEGLVVTVRGRGTFVARDVDLRDCKVTSIGLVFLFTPQTFFSSDYLQSMFRGLMIEAGDSAIDVQIFSIKKHGDISPKLLAENGVDGVVLCEICDTEYLRRFLADAFPTVVADAYVPDVPLEYVSQRNADEARRVVDHLVQLGHKRIEYYDNHRFDIRGGKKIRVDTHDMKERREGYYAAMADHGLKDHIRVHVHANTELDVVEALMRQWDKDGSRPDALLAYDAPTAGRVMTALQKQGLSVPEDLSVAGVVGPGPLMADGRVVTSCQVDFAEMGRRVVEQLKQRAKSGRAEHASRSDLDFTFIPGQTASTPRGRTSLN